MTIPGEPGLIGKISRKTAKVSVVGQGYIGLPTALLIADSGFKVIGYDINERLIDLLSKGKTPFQEDGLEDMLKRNLVAERYRPTSKAEDVKGSDVIIIAVPTPKSKDGPNLSMLLSAFDTALESVGRGGLIVVESTLPPGTFDSLVRRAERRGFKVGVDLFMSYCPERALPGKLIRELRENYRIIGSLDRYSGEATRLLYSYFVEGEIILEDVRVVEVVKLVENSFRDVNIAFANEVARICDVLGIDVHRVIELANKHPRVNMLRPGVGVGGSCLTKDPLFLYWASTDRGFEPRVILESRRINDEMPLYSADQLIKALSILGIKRGKVAVLGVTYKGNVSDTRESPARDFIRRLMERGMEVVVYDPFTEESFGAPKAENLEEALEGSVAVAFLADHDVFKYTNLKKYREIIGNGVAVLFDGRMMFTRREAEEAGFIYVGPGAPLRVSPLTKKLSSIKYKLG